jgi:pimeloyl-ACP methyl ester carboxylesterase
MMSSPFPSASLPSVGARLRLLGQLRLEYDAAPVDLRGNAQRLPAFVGVHGRVGRFPSSPAPSGPDRAARRYDTFRVLLHRELGGGVSPGVRNRGAGVTWAGDLAPSSPFAGALVDVGHRAARGERAHEVTMRVTQVTYVTTYVLCNVSDMNTSEKNPTLVFIPCLSGAPWSAEQLAPYGAAPTRTLRLPEGVNDIERYADHVESAIADLDDFVLVGDSFGANVALALATRRPQGLRALVVSGGFAANPVDSKSWKALMRAIGKARGPFYRQLTLRAHAHRLASPFDGEGQVSWSEPRSRELFLANTPAASFDARVRAALTADYVDVLGRVQVPTLILTPSHDVLMGEDASKTMLAGIPDAREVVLPRTGRMFRFSHPVTYAAAVDDFLAALPATRQGADA